MLNDRQVYHSLDDELVTRNRAHHPLPSKVVPLCHTVSHLTHYLITLSGYRCVTVKFHNFYVNIACYTYFGEHLLNKFQLKGNNYYTVIFLRHLENH